MRVAGFTELASVISAKQLLLLGREVIPGNDIVVDVLPELVCFPEVRFGGLELPLSVAVLLRQG